MMLAAYAFGALVGSACTLVLLSISPAALKWVNHFAAWVMEEESE